MTDDSSQADALLIVTTTSDDRAVLQTISDSLVRGKLAACCQISGPITSIYQWDGKVENAEEFACHIKTTASLFDDVVQLIQSRHNYDVPQIVGHPITHCSAAYRQWLLDAVRN